MIKRNKGLLQSAGILTLISSIILAAFNGLLLLVVGGYSLSLGAFAGAIGASGSNIFGSLILTVFIIFLPPLILAIICFSFSIKLLQFASRHDYFYKRARKSIITFMVFIAVLLAGVFVLHFLVANSIIQSSSSEIVAFEYTNIVLIISAVMYVISLGLMLADLIVNKKFAKMEIAPPQQNLQYVLVNNPQTIQPMQPQQQMPTQQPVQQQPTPTVSTDTQSTAQQGDTPVANSEQKPQD